MSMTPRALSSIMELQTLAGRVGSARARLRLFEIDILKPYQSGVSSFLNRMPPIPQEVLDTLNSGEPKDNKSEAHKTWREAVHYMENLVDEKLIQKDKIEEFKSVYKDPDEFCCLFVVDGEFTKFLFIPYPED